jgi:uncharacterized membrane protein YidH (DUF202 family)
MGDIFSLQEKKPIMTINSKRNFTNIYGQEEVGPPRQNTTQKEVFSWNNLISTLGSSISSIFGGLAGMKNAEAAQNYQQYQRQKTNNMLWIGIAVVVVIVLVVIFATRKK